MARTTTRIVPSNPQLFRAEVVRTFPVSPNMQRVTIAHEGLTAFPWLGFDQWFRLFVRKPHQDAFTLPDISGKKWWKEFLEIPEDVRPHCANYTVADYRGDAGEMDIDFVIHCAADGSLEGAAAQWACSVQPGEQMALLDQGRIFDRPDDAAQVIIVADETGLPGVAGILRSLPDDAVGRVIQEIPAAVDQRELAGPSGMQISWIVRDDATMVAGVKALEALKSHADVHPMAYGFVVGESTLATEGRRHLHKMGVPKERITFSGFWKHD
ncbi:siderophore-interacting protein [Glaciihabitans sp. dw_435]|uniref:siderophore-interacting protein n=1 Tax=Glaciihabitans sp. dw_435 TaxID=2720081 RepID=UPI001BD48CEC|nr:siderophore-interacting protein [Glaciihabitans sp. dw_435]